MARHTRKRFRWPSDDLFGDIDVEVGWNPRRRTRMGISFDQDGTLHVEVPPGVSLREVRQVLHEHRRWVLRNVHQSETKDAGFPSHYVDGAILLHRGRPLCLRTDKTDEVRRDGESLLAPQHDTKRRAWHWYAREAAQVLAERLSATCPRLPWVMRVPVWRHSYMRAQWGSCSASGRLSLNTHLVKLADDLVDYVLVHELCHLKHLDHGPGFYALMQRSLPDWKERRRRLNERKALLAEPPPEATALA